jgi:hypothetical protein
MTFAPREGAPLAQVVEDKSRSGSGIPPEAREEDGPWQLPLRRRSDDDHEGRAPGDGAEGHRSCGTMVFGSAMCYQISDKDNARFWKIFPEIRSALER